MKNHSTSIYIAFTFLLSVTTGGVFAATLDKSHSLSLVSQADTTRIPVDSSREELSVYEKEQRIKELESRLNELEKQQEQKKEREKIRAEIKEELFTEYNLTEESTANAPRSAPEQTTADELTAEERQMINDQIDSLLIGIVKYEANITGNDEKLQVLERQIMNDFNSRIADIDDLQEVRTNVRQYNSIDARALEDLLNQQIDLLERRETMDERRFRDEYNDLQIRLRNMQRDFEDDIGLNRLLTFPTVQSQIQPNTPGPEEVRVVIEDQRSANVPQTQPQDSVRIVQTGSPDRDKDGIVDDIDRCPNVAGVMANEGCPAEERKVESNVPETEPTPPTTRVIQTQPEIVEVERKMNFLAQSIFFAVNSSTIKGSSETQLDQIYTLMSQYPDKFFVVEGHTDSSGPESYNKELSQKRAQAVVDYLVNKGLSEDDLAAIGFGESRPIAPNDTEEGREKNRRVVIRLR